jgi:hypothetical protein
VAHATRILTAVPRFGVTAVKVAPFAVTLAVLCVIFVKGPFLYDFKGGLYDAGRDVLHGHNPYRLVFLEHEAAVKRAGGQPETSFSVPVYPAPALLAATPLALLPYRLAGLIWLALSAGALVLALRIAGVSDRRCYALAFAPMGAIDSFVLGALTPLLCLGIALVWRYRERALPAAAAVTAVTLAKLFLWPLAVWLVIRGRLRAAALSAVLIAAATFFSWAAIGFAGFTDYPRMVADLAYVSEGAGVSTVAGLLALGAGHVAARVIALGAACLLLLVAARLRRSPDGDRRSFSLAVVAGLVASPMVWPHYLVLLIVPIALTSPQLSALWYLPLLSYVAPFGQPGLHPWAIAPYLLIVAGVGYATARRPRRPCRIGGRHRQELSVGNKLSLGSSGSVP